jgi:putative phosphoserine phosphatase / 1-acylglycerol-3-phosphate O-acyltransferase
VPIVIRNAEVIAARDSATFNPGTVDVAVYPPIPVDDWTLEDLPDRIAAVRQLYLDTLKDWPHDRLPEVDLGAPKKAAGNKAAGNKAAGNKAAKKTGRKPAEKAPARKSAKKAAAKAGSSSQAKADAGAKG